MKVFGVDFTSSPRKSKPITFAECDLNGAVLTHIKSGQIENFALFESFLARKGPWIAGFDFPFGQPRILLENLGWEYEWESYVEQISLLGKTRWEELLRAYRDSREKGDKQHFRLTDRLAGSRSPMMMYRVPVGKMFFEGAPRLMKSGVSVVPCRPNKSNRIAVEAYPALVARQWTKQAYKNDQKSKQTPEQMGSRELILKGLISQSIDQFDVSIVMGSSVQKTMIEDPSGDTLDAFLCAVQTASAHSQVDGTLGIPKEMDPNEGWIIGAPKSTTTNQRLLMNSSSSSNSFTV